MNCDVKFLVSLSKMFNIVLNWEKLLLHILNVYMLMSVNHHEKCIQKFARLHDGKESFDYGVFKLINF